MAPAIARHSLCVGAMIKDHLWDLKPGLNVGRAALFQLFPGRTDAGDFF
jgi:hypothetical protein